MVGNEKFASTQPLNDGSQLKYWYLKDHKLFRNLSFREINALCILKRFKKSKKNEILELPYTDKERIYFLKEGTIKLIRLTDQGEETLVDVLQKGDLFGDLNFEKSNEQNEFFQVVSEEAIICTFFKEKLEEVIATKPDFALNYIKFIGFRYEKIQNDYRNILFKDARTRLLLLLKSFIEKEENVTNTFILPNHLTQKDFAQLICCTRQTITSLFREFENTGILKYSQKEILIPDIEKIKNLVQDVK